MQNRGALMSYDIDVFDNYRRATDCVSQILKSAKVANLPFQRIDAPHALDQFEHGACYSNHSVACAPARGEEIIK